MMLIVFSTLLQPTLADCLDAHWWNDYSKTRPCSWLIYERHCLVYHEIWKAANDAIRHALFTLSYRLANATFINRVSSKVVEDAAACDTYLHFTFVREPLRHLVSGYSEYKFRAMVPSWQDIEYGPPRHLPVFHADEQYRQDHSLAYSSNASLLHSTWSPEFAVSARMAATDLSAIFDSVNGGKPVCVDTLDAVHMFPQTSGIQRRFRASFIGRLENASRDWERLMNWLPLRGKPMASDALALHETDHVTSSDVQGARQSAWEALARNETLRGAACRALLSTYREYGYNLTKCLSCEVCSVGALSSLPSSSASASARDELVRKNNSSHPSHRHQDDAPPSALAHRSNRTSLPAATQPHDHAHDVHRPPPPPRWPKHETASRRSERTTAPRSWSNSKMSFVLVLVGMGTLNLVGCGVVASRSISYGWTE